MRKDFLFIIKMLAVLISFSALSKEQKEEEHLPYHDDMIGLHGEHDELGVTEEDTAPNPQVVFTKEDLESDLLGLDADDLQALWVIMRRTGQERLHIANKKFSRSGYIPKSKVKRGIGTSSIHMLTDPLPWLQAQAESLMRTLKGKSRYDMIEPLENLTARVSNKVLQNLANGNGSEDDQQKLAHLLLGATNSLNLSLIHISEPTRRS